MRQQFSILLSLIKHVEKNQVGVAGQDLWTDDASLPTPIVIYSYQAKEAVGQ